MRNRNTAIALILLSGLLAGCQTAATPTTRPSLATLTTGAENALDGVVNGITVGIKTGAISKATYWRDIDPVVVAAQASGAAMRDAARRKDADAARAASDAVLAAVAKLTPYVRFPPTTQKAN